MEPNAQTWRLFVAIDVPEGVRQTLGGMQRDLRKRLAALPVRWTLPEQFHLTLRFLGDVTVDRAGALSAALDSAALSFAPPQLEASGLGFFPNARRPRVLWVGLTNADGTLVRLAEAVAQATADFTSEPPAEKFHAHVTLGRIRELRRSELELLSRTCDGLSSFSAGPWVAEELVLMRSELGSAGARHSVISRHPLGGALGQRALPRLCYE